MIQRVSETVDLLVVGGGVVGAMTAWSAARRGAGVLVAEARTVGHDQAGSHGSGRILRLTDERAAQVRAARASLERWHALAAETEPGLVRPAETVEHLPPAQRRRIEQALAAAGETFDVLDPVAAAVRWPQLRACWPVLHQRDGAAVHADRAWRAAATASRRAGARWREGAPVSDIKRVTEGIHARVGEDHLRARAVVITAGTESRPLATALGIDLPAVQVHHIQTAVYAPQAGAPLAAAWPVLRHRAPTGNGLRSVYALGVEDGVRLGRVGGTDTIADHAYPTRPAARQLRDAAEHVAHWLPGLQAAGAAEPPCRYAQVDGGAGIWCEGPVVVALGCDGGWFKHAPRMGEQLGGIALACVSPR